MNPENRTEAPRLDVRLPQTAGCQCAMCRARRGNPSHPNREAVYEKCLCAHDGDGVWRDCPSCVYHGTDTARARSAQRMKKLIGDAIDEGSGGES